MSCCCASGDPAGPSIAATGAARRSRRWRTRALIEWSIPITVLAVVPKCPGCIAAYVLVFTGVSLSFSAAAAVRGSLIGICIAAIAFFLLRSVRRAVWARPAVAAGPRRGPEGGPARH